MDERKTTQALKQIFDQCGTGILKERKRFEGYLEDLLSGGDCASERKLLLHALDSNALPLLLRQPVFSGSSARQTVEMLQNDIYVSEEAARFVVRCVVAARGGDPKIVDGAAPEPPKPSKPVPEPPRSAPVPPASPSLQPTPCFLTTPRGYWKPALIQEGEVQLYQNKLVFTPSTARERTEILFHNVTKIEMDSNSQLIGEIWKLWGVFFLVVGSVLMLMVFSDYGLAFDYLWIAFLGYLFGVYIVVGLISTLLFTILTKGGVSLITVQVKKKRHFIRIKDLQQCKQVYAALQQGIHQYP